MNKGFTIGPSSSAGGPMPRETREQRLARRQAQAEQRQRDQAAQLSRALQRQIVNDDFGRYDRSTQAVIDPYVVPVSPYSTQSPNGSLLITPGLTKDEPMTDVTQDPPSASAASVDSTTSSEASFRNTPVRSITPTGTVMVSVCENSRTIIARPGPLGFDQALSTHTEGRSLGIHLHRQPLTRNRDRGQRRCRHGLRPSRYPSRTHRKSPSDLTTHKTRGRYRHRFPFHHHWCISQGQR